VGRSLGIEVMVAITRNIIPKFYEWRDAERAQHAASCIHIAQDLKAALND
jgi:hypothetical protein